MMSFRAVLALVAIAVSTTSARAEDRIGPPHHRRDLPIVLAGTVLYAIVDGPAEDALTPDGCRWCADNALDRGLRDALLWDDRSTANTLSNVGAYIAVPVAGAGLLHFAAARDGRGGEWFHNGVIVAEAAVLASNATFLVKAAVGRERPEVHALAPADKPGRSEDNLSFYSGHSAIAMSVAVAAGTTATLRGYRHHRLVWAAAVPFALATGYLRIAADRHWATDVVTGWIAGAAVGFAVPYFMHRRCPPGAPMPVVARTATATTVGVALTW